MKNNLVSKSLLGFGILMSIHLSSAYAITRPGFDYSAEDITLILNGSDSGKSPSLNDVGQAAKFEAVQSIRLISSQASKTKMPEGNNKVATIDKTYEVVTEHCTVQAMVTYTKSIMLHGPGSATYVQVLSSTCKN